MAGNEGAFSNVGRPLQLAQGAHGQIQSDDQGNEASCSNENLQPSPIRHVLGGLGHTHLGAFVGLFVVLGGVATWLIFAGMDYFRETFARGLAFMLCSLGVLVGGWPIAVATRPMTYGYQHSQADRQSCERSV